MNIHHCICTFICRTAYGTILVFQILIHTHTQRLKMAENAMDFDDTEETAIMDIFFDEEMNWDDWEGK